MIRIYIPGFSRGQSGGPRFGDATVIRIIEGSYAGNLVIDGYCGAGTTKLISYLKAHKIKSPYLFISHAHYDHYKGIREIIRDKYFTPKRLYMYDPTSLNSSYSSDVRNEIKTMKAIVSEAKERGIPVSYLRHNQTLKFGGLKMIVYRKQPSGGDCSDSHINDGSLCFWFPDLKYWTSGDGPEKIYDMCKSVGARPVLYKIPHHGNNCPRSQAQGMRSAGALYCWDNDISTSYTEFLLYGRRRCVEAGIKYLSCIGDLNFCAYGGKMRMYKDGKTYQYTCAYKGTNALKSPGVTVVRYTMRGKYGSSNDRATNLIEAGIAPNAAQAKINKVVKLANEIKNGTELGKSYGKNQTRINRIDAEMGKGYGQLVQDYINVLCGVRKEV